MIDCTVEQITKDIKFKGHYSGLAHFLGRLTGQRIRTRLVEAIDSPNVGSCVEINK